MLAYPDEAPSAPVGTFGMTSHAIPRSVRNFATIPRGILVASYDKHSLPLENSIPFPQEEHESNSKIYVSHKVCVKFLDWNLKKNQICIAHRKILCNIKKP